MNQYLVIVTGGLFALVANAATLVGGMPVACAVEAQRDVVAFHAALQDGEEECVHGQGFWKNHPDAWPVDELMLGNASYSQEELLEILNNPPRGNGLVILARQLIAAKLNVADGASTPDDINEAIDDADALIGDLVVPPIGEGWIHPSETGELNDQLGAFNDGERHDEDCELLDPDDGGRMGE